MKFNDITKLLAILFFGGVLGGLVFGMVFALCLFGIIYGIEVLFVFSVIVFPFYIPSIWRQIRQKTYPVIIRKLVEFTFISSLLNVMVLLEGGLINFSSFDMWVIYISIALAGLFLTTFILLETYYNQSWLFLEINHIIKGMQLYGLLPKENEEEREVKK